MWGTTPMISFNNREESSEYCPIHMLFSARALCPLYLISLCFIKTHYETHCFSAPVNTKYSTMTNTATDFLAFY